MTHALLTSRPTARPARPLLEIACAAALLLASGSALAQASVRVQAPGVDRTSSQAVFAADEFNNGVVIGTGTASAGAGHLSTFASTAAGRDSTPFIDDIGITARASVADHFTIHLNDPNVPTSGVFFHFLLEASGSASYGDGCTAVPSIVCYTGFAQSSWTANVTSNGTASAFAGSIASGRESIVENKVISTRLFTDRTTGLGMSAFEVATPVLPLDGGDLRVDVVFFAEARARVVSPDMDARGSFTHAVADFGHTLKWLGLDRVTLADGTPYTGGFTITSASGFDYGQALAVPEPASAGSLVAGLLLLAGLRRRREQI